ncbi:nicotinate-nucleotide-dimethylbenzimidazole phosphoribosyltransferase [Thiobacillus denitrificans ATCC 25259]|uniref:Nicotinate-nucleotide--dimethylbenzimidazole phosphoribosyltransferase n=1 Tax=Thiobacillus denitrificans (strain ATCC 25259 / T1) TaxID=292415 RepID=Q3SFE5_THIDA|nr:nicotinate-nucleotide--dimethylbenzimidazole phosphoribosyltransferase [Thiobacillus denitrificans]AAZ98665.1 nicotinate-nucleotide-dimethylbenzimidazole phosphoribosyltransferase [Thiobacillus denitrificans ATCC 25259]
MNPHAAVKPLDEAARAAALARQAQLTKPAGSLGRLEEIAIQLAAMQGTLLPRIHHPWISIFAADHGVADEGVSAFPQAVTQQMLANFVGGGAAISVLARETGATLEVIDVGTLAPSPVAGVVQAQVRRSTANFCRQPAMSAAQAQAALDAGATACARARTAGADLFIGGEMGIANTTAAAALACALLGLPGAALAGAGTGVDHAGVARKAALIDRALALHGLASAPTDSLHALCAVGGFEIGALAGAYLAAAQAGMPVLVDGFICGAAALLAVRLNPGARDWMLFAHASAESGHAALLRALDAQPLLALDMRLGEASGAAAAIPLLRLACALHAGMATFAEAGVANNA